MKFFLVLLILYQFMIINGYQIGIKTKSYPSSANQELSHSHQQYSQNLTVYQHQYPALPNRNGLEANIRAEPVVYVDKTAKFLNETRSKMSSGVCFTEVRTATLVQRGAEVPAGNGSNPSLSKIQVCCDGYERNVYNFLQCDPVCTNGCVNGICVAPEVCICFPDHIRNYAGFCLPTCPIGCGNGECLENNLCQCKPGYVLDVNRKFCAPFCNKGCKNGNCTAPDVCECIKGYELSLEGICEPKCENCLNGKCIEPGVCTCMPGYLRSGSECKPVCNKDCKNGFCSAPNQCGCYSGWTLDSTGTNCIAHCDQPCLNGYCDGNNKCTCHNGYIQDETNPNVCRPHCPQGCANGYCTSPNFCICKPGFIKSGIKGRQQCVPV